MTKLKLDGTLELDDCFLKFMKSGCWEPRHPYGWNSTKLSDPVAVSLEPLPPPLPSTKKMQAKRADANANALSGEKLSFEAGA
jgi:hypothetical protein